MKRASIHWTLAACAQAALLSTAQAQMLEEIELRREGANAVVQIRFVTPVQLQRTVATRNGALLQIYYGILPTKDHLNQVTSERRIANLAGLPAMLLTDEDAERDEVNRRLLLRFDEPTRYRVRPGRDRRDIEVVLEGRGPAISALTPTPPPAPSPLAGDYAVRLLSSTEPGQSLPASIPAEFQDKAVYTTQRVVDGRTVYEVLLGNFPTRPAAESARARLLRRFPAATVAALKAAPAAPPAAAPVPPPAPQPEPPTAPAPVRAAVPPPPLARVVPLPAAPTTTQAEAVAAPSPEAAAAYNTQAQLLLSEAEQAYDRGDYPKAITTLDSLLNLPTTSSSRKAQLLIGMARLRGGDPAGARREFDLYLQLYPTGPDSELVRQQIAALPAPQAAARPRPPKEAVSVTSGSLSLFYYGGHSQVRTLDFQLSPISNLPVLQSENTLSATDLRQLQSTIDLNWRYRDAEKDMRFVFRDTGSADLQPNGINRNRLTALYFDRRSFVNNVNFRIGRQSPSGGGVLYRFDGVQAGYGFAPKWRVNGVAGKPSDDLLDTNRRFAGLSLEAEALTPALSGNVYVIQQTIDSETDRQALGTELRYFSGGLSMFGQLDYDQLFQRVNIASLQGTVLYADNSVLNFLLDRRTTPLLSLGNALFFQDPAAPTIVRTIRELLLSTSLDTLVTRVKGITPFQNQAMLGYTTPVSPKWQAGANVSYTNIGEIPPVDVILPQGQPSTGNLWSLGLQMIGANLYSNRDTHVFNVSLLSGPTYNGRLFSYNNLTGLNDKWQVEPSLRYYSQVDTSDTTTGRWTPGLRLTYRMFKQLAVESEVQYELSEVKGPLREESSTRVFYYLGARYDF